MTSFGATTTADEVAAALRTEIEGKNVLITGVTLGSLGAEVARVLAKYAALVVVAGRNKEKLETAVTSIKAETPGANLRILIIDLLSFKSVRAAAIEVNAYSEPIHVLFSNAAMPLGPYATVEGVESQLYGNHLAHFLFTKLITAKILAAVTDTFSPRIINVSSEAHTFASATMIENYNFDDGKSYTKLAAYANTKCANIMFTTQLAKRLSAEHILSYSLHPGAIATNGAASITTEEKIAYGIMNADGTLSDKITWKSISAGSSTHIVAGFEPSIKSQSGGYLVDCQVRNDAVTEFAANEENAAKLWTLTEKLIGETYL